MYQAMNGSICTATRFIGLMNYGYAGTRELNEALVSRFLVIDMPALTKENLYRIIRHDYPKIKEEALDAFGRTVPGSAGKGR